MASDNNTLRKDLGAVSAYAVAVEHGFDGTEAEWEEYIANASNNAAAANTSKLAAEGYAVGKQNGVDVPSTSPYYENNAKYYAEQTEAAKTTAVQAIEDKGEQVLHSIPSEYTELSGDVEDLKSAFDESINGNIAIGKWHENKHIKSNGNEQTYNGWRATGYLEIGNAKKLTIEATAGSSGSFNAFYNSDKTHLGDNFSFSAGVNTIDIPEGAYYFRLSMPNEVNITIKWWLAVDVKTASNAVKQIIKDESVIYSKEDTVTNFVQGGRVAPDVMSITDNANRCTADRVWYLHQGDKLKISNIANGQRAVRSAVDLNGEMVVSGSWVTTDTEYTISVEGYYYVIVSNTNGNTPITPSEVTTIVTVTDNSSRISENEDDILKIENIIDTGLSKIWTAEDLSQGYWSRRNITADSKRLCNSVLFDVQVGDVLKITDNTNGWYFAIGVYVGSSKSISDATGWVTGSEYDYSVRTAGKLLFQFQTGATAETSQEISPSDFDMTVGLAYNGYLTKQIETNKANINKAINADVKTVAFLGDSLTAGVGTNHIYHMYLAERFGWHCKNYGYGGSGYALSYSGTGGKMATGQEGMGVNITSETKIIPNDFLSRISSIDTNIDALVIFGGTNDWGNGGDTITIEQFRSAVNSVLDYAQTNFGRIPIVVMLPVHRKNDTIVNGQGKTLREYAEMVKDICVDRGVYCIDMMMKSGLYPDNSNNATLYFTRDDTSVVDGVHPNHYAHKVIANILAQTLMGLLY